MNRRQMIASSALAAGFGTWGRAEAHDRRAARAGGLTEALERARRAAKPLIVVPVPASGLSVRVKLTVFRAGTLGMLEGDAVTVVPGGASVTMDRS